MNDKAPVVRTHDVIETFERGNGVVTRLLCNGAICGAQVTTGTTTLPVGRSVARHHHDCDEQIVILAGRAEAEIEGRRFPIGPMEVAFIPEGMVHCFHNVGDEPVLMLFVYDAPEVTRTFADTGETVVHLGAGDRAQPGST
ncbi:cupin domain-containing protein [Salinarimonas ramus]|uniref:Cupin type-2 domain-containing protein n=1 Tax=Salinarimonas ramus TaxID=690164 RepID=A0A917V835_9HYPH|nr:cupin domain-containing protein [Salinarimonas ramus]GGK49180.1 hypothetical protein GCM10011322_40230 [Salinarimonas ramus]